MHARERLYLTADKQSLVGYGDPKAAFLYAAEGDEIPDSAAAKFGLVDGRRRKGRAASQGSSADVLLGSSVLPSMVVISDTLTVQLGDVVRRAHKESGLSVEAWNALAAVDREKYLADTVAAMRAEPAGPGSTSTTEKPEVKPTSKPEVTPTPKPAAAKAPAKKPAAKKAPAKKAPAKKASPRR